MGEETNEIRSDVMWLMYVTLHEQSAQTRKKEQKTEMSGMISSCTNCRSDYRSDVERDSIGHAAFYGE